MKKLLCLMMVLVLVLSGCGIEKSEEEIRAELKEEMKKEEELRAEIKKEIEEEIRQELEAERAKVDVIDDSKEPTEVVNSSENTNINETSVEEQVQEENVKTNEDATVKEEESLIYNESKLIEVAYEEHKFDVDVSLEEYSKKVDIKYWDITLDGEKDALLHNRYATILITEKEGQLYKLDSDLYTNGFASYHFTYDGKFLGVMEQSGGTGGSMAILGIYTYDGSRVKSICDDILISRTENYKKGPKYPNGHKTLLKAELKRVSNDYSEFSLSTVQTGSVEFTKQEHYTYNEDTKVFDIKIISKSDETAIEVNNIIDPSDIKIGDDIGGLTVSSINYEEGKYLFLTLSGDIQIKGYIDIDEEKDNGYIFVSNSKSLDVPIEFALDDGIVYTIDDFSGVFDPSDIIENQMKNYLLADNTKLATANIREIRYGFKDDTPNFVGVSISEFIFDEIEEAWIGYIEGENGKALANLKKESFMTQDGNVEIDYKECKTVIIPMFTSENEDVLDEKIVDFDGSGSFKFTIVGELSHLKVGLLQEMEDQGTWEDLGTLKNTVVTIKADLLGDMSAVKVIGKFHVGEGFYKDIEFSLDDMRSMEQYKVFIFK